MQIIGSVQSHIKIWFFWNVKTYSCIYLKWVHPINVAKEALDRNSWIFDADHWFSSKSRENMIFVKSYFTIYLKWFHSKNMATEPLDRNSWINYLKNEHCYLHFLGIHFVKKQFLCQTCNSASISKISIKTSK